MPVSKKQKRMNLIDKSDDKASIQQCKLTSDIDKLLALLRHESAAVRVAALREICPCHMVEDIDEFWTAVLSMTRDADLAVRKQVMHTLCDGSPPRLEAEVMAAMETLSHDADTDLRRMANKVKGHFQKTGKWNIL